MKIYHIKRTDDVDYDEYDSWVVIAETADKAGELTKYSSVIIQPVGEAYPEQKEGILLGSFNAG